MESIPLHQIRTNRPTDNVDAISQELTEHQLSVISKICRSQLQEDIATDMDDPNETDYEQF